MKVAIFAPMPQSALIALRNTKGIEGIELVSEQNAELPNTFADAQVAVIRSTTKIDEKFLLAHPKLQLIVTMTSGFDHIDVKLCQSKNILTAYTPDANAQAAAEHTLHLILATLKRANETQNSMRQGNWRSGLSRARELSGMSVGIIGLGRVGQKVAQFAKAFGAKVHAHDPYQADQVFQKLGIIRESLTEVLVQADLLTLHVPLTKETKHMMSFENLETLPAGCFLINTSRGKVIDEMALVSVLDSSHIQGVGLDVFENEPLGKDHRLRKFKNVFLSPHVGAFTEEAFERGGGDAVLEIQRFVATKNIQNPIPLEQINL